MHTFDDIIAVIRTAHNAPEGPVPLHAPRFCGNEGDYVQQTIASTFVSSVGAFVDRFEAMLREATGARHVIATVNGTAALHMALLLAGVRHGDIVLTQAVSFVATCNAIAYCGAAPAFVDIDADTLGLSPDALRDFLHTRCERTADGWRERASGRRIGACVPMHTFGHPCRIAALAEECARAGIPLVEDAAEALGSYGAGGRHAGTFGLFGTLSFNGNKIITCGGGGAILTDDPQLGPLAKHMTTTAKLPHRWLYRHDMTGYNYRLPNINAALGCAQLENLDAFVADKRDLAATYARAFAGLGVPFVVEPAKSRSNYWLNAILMDDAARRDAFLAASNDAGVMTRPVWEPLCDLPMYADCAHGPLTVTRDIAGRLVNIPSSVRGTAGAA